LFQLLWRFCWMISLEGIIVQVTVEILWDDFSGRHHCSSYCGDSVGWFLWKASWLKLLWRFCGMISVECIIIEVTLEILWDDFSGRHHCSCYCGDSVGRFQWKAWVLMLLWIILVEDKIVVLWKYFMMIPLEDGNILIATEILMEPRTSSEVKKTSIYISTPRYVFMA
jgi:hypothetical protein